MYFSKANQSSKPVSSLRNGKATVQDSPRPNIDFEPVSSLRQTDFQPPFGALEIGALPCGG